MRSMNNILQTIELSGIRRFNDEAQHIKDCVSLTIGEPDFNTSDCIKEAVKHSLDANQTHYPPSNGTLALRKSIAAFESTCGLHYDEHEIIVTAGATEALYVTLCSIINPGDEIIVPIPGYTLYQPLIEVNRGVFIPLDTIHDDFQITKQSLLKCITTKTKALLLTSPNNPTGTVYSVDTLQMIHDIVKEKDIFVICDDVYSQLIFQEDFIRLASFQDLKENLIVINSLSKPYAMTGWRIGYVMAEKYVIKQMEKLHQYIMVSTPSIVQEAAALALHQDVSNMRQSYHKRRDYVYQRLCEMGFSVVKPQGAFYIFPSIKAYHMDSLTFCRTLLKDAKLAIIPGIYFGCDNHVRISYCYSEKELCVAMDRLASFMKKLTSI